ncbi:predicted protein [Phaeodactylum tricornutum CCAP 1055/1]|uniref:Uncharacterized protein n=1 Tax=Phaeodactylum tricornutum (strain CCAP 1055/1) TaxID=556484 RepID=B7FZJ0_PHATC|nr:predicted protein [Phaeodactylum tricornutum CCAP 1055/1]EEC48146.1 predicted protein [Phaeodactylum tricornutum CCAP 1055/1]|eukprot:XP_002179955.1 predicted protein [Phaeodactylum tricornutum CCAP 1055/1]
MLNRMPELKSFLKDGEAEWYVGVNVTYVTGRRAVMHIYNEGGSKTKKALHALMAEEEFVKRSEEAVEMPHEERQAGARKWRRPRKPRKIMNRDQELALKEATLRKQQRHREPKLTERDLLGKTAPTVTSPFLLYGGLLATASCTSVRRRRTRRRHTMTIGEVRKGDAGFQKWKSVSVM